MDFASALEHAAALRAHVAKLATAAAAAPDDRGLRITLLSAQRLAKRAEQDLEAAAATSQVDLCRYRVVKNTDGPYAAEPLAESIVAYQALFTALFDFVKNGPKTIARYTNQVREASVLNIGYTFPGSMGVLFTIANERDLFNDGELDRIIEGLNTVADISSTDDVRKIAHSMGLNVIRNAFKWADQNWNAEYSVDIHWTRSDAVTKGGFLPRKRFLDITSAIKQTTDVEPREFDIKGTLVGLHVMSGTFTLATEDGATYSGRLGSGFAKAQYKVPSVYKARLLESTVVNYATEAVTTTYQLLQLIDG